MRGFYQICLKQVLRKISKLCLSCKMVTYLNATCLNVYVKTKISGTKPSQTTTLDTIAYKFPKSCNISLKSEKVGIYFIFKYATIV